MITRTLLLTAWMQSPVPADSVPSALTAGGSEFPPFVTAVNADADAEKRSWWESSGGLFVLLPASGWR